MKISFNKFKNIENFESLKFPRPKTRKFWIIKISQAKSEKNLDHFSICACHPCAGAMLIFSVSFQFYRMSPKRQQLWWPACYMKDVYLFHVTDVGINCNVPTPSSVSVLSHHINSKQASREALELGFEWGNRLKFSIIINPLSHSHFVVCTSNASLRLCLFITATAVIHFNRWGSEERIQRKLMSVYGPTVVAASF